MNCDALRRSQNDVKQNKMTPQVHWQYILLEVNTYIIIIYFLIIRKPSYNNVFSACIAYNFGHFCDLKKVSCIHWIRVVKAGNKWYSKGIVRICCLYLHLPILPI